MTLLAIFAENLAYRMRIIYFKNCLEKDASYFDEHNQSEMAPRIASECSAVQRGVGDNVGHIFSGVSAGIIGFSVAFVFGWKLSLILIAFVPILAIVGIVMVVLYKQGVDQNMRAFS